VHNGQTNVHNGNTAENRAAVNGNHDAAVNNNRPQPKATPQPKPKAEEKPENGERGR
jgi:hypothetical protein